MADFVPIDAPLGASVFPPRPVQPLASFDSRTIALRALADFLATLEFRRPGAKGTGETIAFHVARENILIEWPDNETDLAFPSIAFLPARGTYSYYGLGPARLQEETFGKFGPGTVLATVGEYVEQIMLEVWAAGRAERFSLVAGLEAAFLFREGSTALRLRLPQLFNLTATFSLDQRENMDDPDNARNRRRARLYVTVTVPLVRLVNAVEMQPFGVVDPVVDLTVQTDIEAVNVLEPPG